MSLDFLATRISDLILKLLLLQVLNWHQEKLKLFFITFLNNKKKKQ